MSDDQTQKTIPNSRAVDPQDSSAAPDFFDTLSTSILTKDVPLNPTHNTFERIFLPSDVLENNPSKKLPLVVYYHGGRFISLSAASSINHDFCSKMAAKLATFVVSIDYSIAPMHHLFAAYEDAVEALHWIKSADDVWLRQFADVSKRFLMGTSAGGNISYHACLRASTTVDEFAPLKIGGSYCTIRSLAGSRGLLLSQGYLFYFSDFMICTPMLPHSSTDRLWDLALPIGLTVITSIPIRWPAMIIVPITVIEFESWSGGSS